MSSIKNIIISQATYNDITDKSTSGILSYLATENLYDPNTQIPIVYLESTKEIICNGTPYGGGIKLNDLNASIVPYSNTDSTLQSTNVQNAINELDAKIYDADNYETVVLAIGSADSSFSPVGQTVTVTLEDGSITTYTIPSSLQISFTIQKGIRYTISMTSTADYRCLPISFIARIPTRYITMRYIPIATGVFILQKDGNYYLREEYDAETMAEDAVGVLVLTSALINAGFGIVIAKDIRRYTSTFWPSGGQPSGTNTSTTSLDGYVVTTRVHGNYPTTNCAINKAFTEVLQMDDRTLQGYLGSRGEWTIIINNQNEINNALLRVSTNTIDASNKLTSTPNGPYGSWYRWYTSTSLANNDASGSTFPFFYYKL